MSLNDYDIEGALHNLNDIETRRRVERGLSLREAERLQVLVELLDSGFVA